MEVQAMNYKSFFLAFWNYKTIISQLIKYRKIFQGFRLDVVNYDLF